MDASQLSELSSNMEEEEMFTPSECSSECSSELEEMFNASSEMPEEQSVSEDDVGIKQKTSVSTESKEEMSEIFGRVLDIFGRVLDILTLNNRPPEANIADEIPPPQQAVIISEPLSPEALKDSEDLNQLDILKGQTAAADQVANKIPEGPPFQIMKIVSDKQELSFVDKVHLPEEQILGLCNRILPNAADNHEYPDIRIDFKSLNQLSLPTIGFYGDKRTMGRILREMGVVYDSIHNQMEEEKFEAGLYVGRLEQVIIVFYWHQETHLKDASRKNVSCNFIRYVVDLCDDVYVCVEDHNLLAATSVGSGTTSLSTRKRRTEKLKIGRVNIGRVKNSENDVTVSSGFHINIGRHISTIMPKQTIFFAEGYHRCAFLTANYRGSRKYVKPQKRNGQVGALASELQTLSKDYDLDYTRLSNVDFVCLLKYATFPESQCYIELKDSLKIRKLESEKKANETLQEKQLKTKEENFLTETKKKLSRRRANGKRMYITGCSVSRAYYTLEISSEEEENPSIQWMIVELPPNKKDLDELNLNPMHCIIPSCSNPFELVCCDPEIENLKKVAYLKSGELLVFLHDKENNRLDLYMSPKIGQFLHGRNHLHSFKRGFDLVAFDERTRFLALYDAQASKVVIYKFDESFRNIDWTGVEIMLSLFSGSTNIKWMQCVPGKAELVLVDDTNRLRVAELHHRPLMKPKSMTLSSDFLNAFISGDGSFLFVFHTPAKFSDQKEECASSSAQGAAQEKKPTSEFELKVYMLGDAMSFLKNISLNINVGDVRDLQVKLVYYGSQIHFVVYSDVVPSFSSKILNLVSATEALEFEELGKQKSTSERDHKNAMDRDSQNTSSATLDYIYHIFDKFAVDPALFRGSIRDLHFHVLLKSRNTIFGKVRGQGKYEEYLKNVIGRLKQEKGKDFSNLRIQFKVQTSESCDSNSIHLSLPHYLKKPLGNWVRQLICLVPVQVTRAENNGLQPLLDGLQIPPHLTYADSISLATLLRFGLYDAVLSQWDGKIKVVSSMGKQSSGKSFLLNHLSGSLFDVAGGKCTDGVWMTVRMDSECLYVLMDSEGLGSFERTEQEDLLLSVLNAALSNLTIFNKKDFHLDKETEVIFQRFQSGVSLVKEDEKLFKGVFYIAIKDVDVSDVDELKDEFCQKLLQICQKSRENFLTKMYGSVVVLAAMAPFTRREYHQESLSDIASTIEELGHSYENGRAFLRDLKLVMSQIAVKDWTSVDMKRVAMKVDILRVNLASAVKAGCISVAGAKKMLMNFDSQEEVSDAPILLGHLSIDLQDTGLELAPLDESTSKDRILNHLRSILESVLDRRGKSGDSWHSKFEDFIEALADRRCDRVQRWLRCNTAEFSGNDDVQKFQLEAFLALAELKQGLSVCGCKCSVCFWRCVLGKGHSSDHSCMGNHVCAEKCTYCSLELHQDQENEVEECKHLAGHEGNHDCKMKNHTCAEICSLFDKSSNCSKSCCLTIGHEGTHKCNSSQHLCNMKCSLPSCKNPCVIQIELGDHDKHACHERFCPKDCIMEGCRRSCGYKDHFHELTSNEHLCGEKHGCPKECEADGICEISTELVRHTRSFQGRRGSFEYIHLSEQNGKKKNCCIDIPPFKTSHDGVHLHTPNPDVVHHCNVKCQACGYFCRKPIDHTGLHNTVHGNMRNVKFVSDQEEFDVEGRKYAWGESGVAEMCNLHCKAQGRGHIHLIPCPINDGLPCTSHIYDGSRHETRKYGPDVDVPKDELNHETYWMQMRFEDPCTEEDQKEFALCNHLCRSEEHKETDGSSTKSYCTQKLWHAPVQRTSSTPSSGGHITADGHRFLCDHLKNVPHHVVFVIDRSFSMSSPDIRPNLAKCIPRHNSRLGCVYESIDRFIKTRLRTSSDDSVSVILFDDTATLALERQEMKEDIVDGLLQYDTMGLTSYSSGLTMAEEVICRGSNDPNVEKKKPIIIFLSDGGNNDGQDPLFFVNKLKKTEPKLILHTIMYGTDPEAFILEKMAEIGNGTFQLSLDELQLARSFENLAISLEPNVVSVIPVSRSNP